MNAWFILPALFFLCRVGPACAQLESDWTVTDTQHFSIHHEDPALNLGDYTRIERIYETLHPDLWSLVPWMTIEKTPIYIYKSRASYARGRFHPPAWSGGLLRLAEGEKALAIFLPVETQVVAHELTHLYFHAFFAEKQADAPAWLDEGLANLLQDEVLTPRDPREKGPVLDSPMPLERFFKIRPGQDAPGSWVSAWYRQAQSVVWFLKRGHIEASFTDFCGKLRAGEALEDVLREVYGYPDLVAFETAWQKWRPK